MRCLVYLRFGNYRYIHQSKGIARRVRGTYGASGFRFICAINTVPLRGLKQAFLFVIVVFYPVNQYTYRGLHRSHVFIAQPEKYFLAP